MAVIAVHTDGRILRAVWMQATCNPIRNADGVPMKVVKDATDQARANMQNVVA